MVTKIGNKTESLVAEKEKDKLIFSKETCINGNIANTIYQKILESGKDDVVLINIGTDLIVGDCLGPLIGSNLLTKVDNINIFGTLDKLINAKNINKTINDILETHKDAYIIAIDACIGKEDAIGSIVLSNGPMKAGEAFRNDLIPVGDCAIKGIVSYHDSVMMFSHSVRLSLVMKMAKKIESEILELDKLLSGSKITFDVI